MKILLACVALSFALLPSGAIAQTFNAGKFARDAFKPVPFDWNKISDGLPKPKSICDCNNPSKGGCEAYLCTRPDLYNSAEMRGGIGAAGVGGAFTILKSPKTPYSNICHFCELNPGAPICLTITCAMPSYKSTELEEIIKGMKLPEYNDAVIDLRRTKILNQALRDAGVITRPEYREFKSFVNEDLDFLLDKKPKSFEWKNATKPNANELKLYRYDATKQLIEVK